MYGFIIPIVNLNSQLVFAIVALIFNLIQNHTNVIN